MSEVIYECPDGTPFPVEWPDAMMSKYGWRWDQLHIPTPLTPLSQDLMQLFSAGMARGGEQIGARFGGDRFFANGYPYTMPKATSSEEDDLISRIAERDAGQRIDILLDLWNTRYRPEVETLTRALQTWASPGESLDDMLSRFDEVEATVGRLGEVHTLAMGLSNTAMNRFQAWCTDRFGEQDGQRISEVAVGGMQNKSLESAQVLWDLSREARSMPAVGELLRTTHPSKVIVRLSDVKQGLDFRALLDQFLDEWGVRNESFYELEYPTWREDPGFVLFTLASYLDAPDNRSPLIAHERAVERRDAVVREARERLNDPGLVEEFLTGQRRAQQRTVIVEDHNYYIDQRAYSSLRIPILTIGEALQGLGVIEEIADVLYLYQAELPEAAEHPGLPWAGIVSQRRGERDIWMDVVPPTIIGDGEVGLNPGMERIIGPSSAVETQDGEVRGLAGSAGKITGTARVVLTLGDASRLQAGDILITYATTPAWTPLFAVASGVVTDSGGPLAHCAIVAREYGIPAVVGTKSATARIEDGATITVDGSQGIVTIDG